jgi:hypothetical protein
VPRAGVLVEVQRAEPAARAALYAKHRVKLDETMRETTRFPSLRDTRGRCRRRLAKDLRQVTPLFAGFQMSSVGIAAAFVGGSALIQSLTKERPGWGS